MSTYSDQNAGITNGTKFRALKELECMNEAMCEMDNPETSDERKAVLWQELCSRVWAGIYVLQYRDMPAHERPEHYEQIMKQADAFDCTGSLDDHLESGLFDDDEMAVH